VNRRKPHVQTPVVSRYPAPAQIDDFVLLFLPPCGPHLTLLATGSLESCLLVSPLLGGPARHRPFTLTLHLHQHKSRRNLHPQYSVKSQSTPRCQSLITTRSDHPPVLGHSGPHGTASPPRARRAGMAAPSRARWAGAAAPSQAHLAGPAAPSRAHQAGAAAPSPSPASWMARLTMPCARLRKKKLLDSLLGDRRRWCWGFLSVVVDEVLGRPGFILTKRRTVRQPVTRLGTCVRSGELLATKRIMWSQGDM
jgi:hypothetical protein